MALIHIQPSGETVDVQDGSRLRQLARRLETSLPCQQGICGTCTIRVVEGLENLALPGVTESHTLARRALPDNIRLLCRSKVNSGEVVLEPYHDDTEQFSELRGPQIEDGGAAPPNSE